MVVTLSEMLGSVQEATKLAAEAGGCQKPMIIVTHNMQEDQQVPEGTVNMKAMIGRYHKNIHYCVEGLGILDP